MWLGEVAETGFRQDRPSRCGPGRRLKLKQASELGISDRRRPVVRAGRRGALMTSQFNGFGEKAIPFLKALDFHQSRGGSRRTATSTKAS